MKTKITFVLILIFAFIGMAAQKELGLDSLVIGGRSSTANKQIKFKGYNNSIRLNTTSNKLEFSNDGSTFSELGSGASGASGGIDSQSPLDFTDSNNLIANPGFESGTPISNWTSTGTLAPVTVSPGFGLRSGGFVSTIVGQTLHSDFVNVPNGLKGRACSLNFFYRYQLNIDNVYDVFVQKNDSTILKNERIRLSKDWRVFTLNFTCPESGQVRVGFVSLKAGTNGIEIDNVSMSNRFFRGSRTAGFVGGVDIDPQGDTCTPDVTSSTPAPFVEDDECESWNSLGGSTQILAEGGVPKFKIAGLSAGNYIAFVNVLVVEPTQSSGSNHCSVNLKISGNLNTRNSSLTSPTEYSFLPIDSNEKTYPVSFFTSGGDVEFELLGYGGGTCRIYLGDDFNTKHSIKVFKLSSLKDNEENVFTVGTRWNYRFEYLSDSAAGKLWGNVASSPQYINGNFKIERKLSPYSALAFPSCYVYDYFDYIFCASTDHLTVAQEQLGFLHYVPSPGVYRYCFDFNVDRYNQTNYHGETYFSIHEISLRGDKILQSGSVQVSNGVYNLDSLGIHRQVEICDELVHQSSGPKQVAVKYTQRASPPRNTRYDMIKGQFKIRARKLLDQTPSPAFVDFKKALKGFVSTGEVEKNLKFCGFEIDASSSQGSEAKDYGDCVKSVERSALGVYFVTFEDGYANFGKQPICKCEPKTSTLSMCIQEAFLGNVHNRYKYKMFTINASGGALTAADEDFSVVCLSEET